MNPPAQVPQIRLCSCQLPVARALDVDALCVRFEQEWNAGSAPVIESFLESAPPELHARLVRELLAAERGLRRRDRLAPLDPDECRHRFPDFADEIAEAFGDTLGIDEGVTAPLPRAPGPVGRRPRQFGDYELLEQVGGGGMGVVYRARQVGLNRTVAIKMIRSGQQASPQEIQRFQVEASAAAKLRHPNIVPIHEIGEMDGQIFYSMEFIDGPTLAQCVAKQPFSPREAARLTKTIASAVSFAHAQGILHRDLTPNNVLLDPPGEPWITDFGLARPIHQDGNLTRTGEVIGTPSYMSPEQARGRSSEVGVAADVYSLGAILYFLLTGRPPFHAANAFETIKQVLESEPAPPRRLNPAIDRDLDTICRKCLEKSPQGRYGAVDELAEDLERYLRHEPIRARPVSMLVRAAQWSRRKPLAAFSILVCIVALMGTVQFQIRLSAARQVAATHRYHGALNAARRVAEEGQVEWTRNARVHLESAARLRPAAADPAESRTLAARTLGAWDLRRIGELPQPDDVGAIAFSQDGTRLAVAELLNDDRLTVCVYDPETQILLAQYGADVAADRQEYERQNARRTTPAFIAAAFSPDGQWLAAATRHGKAYCWDTRAPTSEPYDVWQAHDHEIRSLAFSADSHLAVTSTVSPGPLHRRDVKARVSLPDIPGNYMKFVFHPDGKSIVFGDGPVRIEDAQTLAEISQLEFHVGDFGLSGDGKWLVAHTPDNQLDRDCLSIARLPSGDFVRRLRDPVASAEVSYRAHTSFTADDRLVICSCTDGEVRVWEVDSGALVAQVTATGGQYPVAAVDRRGGYLAVAGNARAELHEIVHPGAAMAITGSPYPAREIEFAPHRHELAIVSELWVNRGPPATSLLLLDVEDRRRIFETVIAPYWPASRTDFRHSIAAVAFRPQGDEIAWGSSRTSLRWVKNSVSAGGGYSIQPGALRELVLEDDALEIVEAPELAAIQPDPVAGNGRALRLSPSAMVRARFNQVDLDSLGPAFACYAVVRVEGAESARRLLNCWIYKDGQYAGRRTISRADGASSAYQLLMLEYWQWPADGTKSQLSAELKIRKEPGLEAVWIDRLLFVPVAKTHNEKDPADWPKLPDAGPYAYSPNGDCLWGLENEKRIRCWSLPGWKSRLEIRNPLAGLEHGDVILRSIACTDDLVVVGARHGELFIFSAHDGRLLRTSYRPGQEIQTVALAATGDIAVVGSDQGTLWVVDVARGDVLADLPAHPVRVTALALSKDGQLLFSGSEDRSVRAWGRRGSTFVELFRLDRLPAPVVSVRLSDDRQRLAILLEGERGVRVWDLGKLNARFRSLDVEVPELATP